MQKNLSKTCASKIAKEFPVELVYLFGSRAKETNTNASDYDFAVLLSSKIAPKQYSRYKLKITESLLEILPKNTYGDVVILNDRGLSSLLKFNIIKDGELLYEHSRERKINTESTIMREWYDQEYFERLWHTIFTRQLARGKII